MRNSFTRRFTNDGPVLKARPRDSSSVAMDDTDETFVIPFLPFLALLGFCFVFF